MSLRVAVVDTDRGTLEETTVQPGDYLLIVASPAVLATTEVLADGTHVLTVRDRLTRPARARTVQHERSTR